MKASYSTDDFVVRDLFPDLGIYTVEEVGVCDYYPHAWSCDRDKRNTCPKTIYHLKNLKSGVVLSIRL